MKSSKQLLDELVVIASRYGATVEAGGGGKRRYEVLVEAPEGHHWAGSQGHELIHCTWESESGKAQSPSDVLREAIDALKAERPEPCDSECEWWA